MAVFGYMYAPADTDEKTRQEIESQCDLFFIDEEEDEVCRPQWKCMFENIQYKDTIILSKLSNAVRGVREMAYLIDYCTKNAIRLISIEDQIDTKDEKYPLKTPSEILQMVGTLPNEISLIRSRATRSTSLRRYQHISMGYLHRDKEVIKLYTSGLPVKDIVTKTGVARVSVYYILRKYNIPRNHYHRK